MSHVSSPCAPCRRAAILEQRKQLPVWSARDAIIKLVEENNAVVIVGETGSGKTTQIPQFLAAAGYAKGGKCVACTQPRRVAAVTVARRVAEEVGCRLGTKVRPHYHSFHCFC